MAKIYVKFNSAVIKEVELTKDETTFGRKPGNDIVIDHPTISGFHGKIRKVDDHYEVVDLNSTNGTFINGRKIKSGQLRDHDQIGAAGHILEFIAVSEPKPAPPPPPPPLDMPAPVDLLPKAAPKPVQPPSQPEQPQAPVAPEAAKTPPVKPASPPITAAKEGVAPEILSLLGLEGAPKGVVIHKETPPPPPMGSEDAAKMAAGGHAVIRIISGAADAQTEFVLKDLVTYIGTSDQAVIKIKGFLAPGLAAAISRRPEGFFLKAVKSGYPKVNGNAVKEQILLESGALIEVGGTNMVFIVIDPNKQPH